MAGTVCPTLMPPWRPLLGTLQLIGSPMVALMIALVLAFVVIGFSRGWSLQHTSDIMGSALPTAAVVILVTGAGGVFGKVLVESGIGKALANMLQMIDLPLLPAAFIFTGAACIADSDRRDPDNRRVTLRSGDGINPDSRCAGSAGDLLWWAGASHVMTQGSGL
ncbi:TRAP transporter large permease subunit [Shigella sonnei]